MNKRRLPCGTSEVYAIGAENSVADIREKAEHCLLCQSLLCQHRQQIVLAHFGGKVRLSKDEAKKTLVHEFGYYGRLPNKNKEIVNVPAIRYSPICKAIGKDIDGYYIRIVSV